VSIPEKELRSLKIEAQNIVTQRKAEEERDLFQLWKEELDKDGRNSKGGATKTGKSSKTAASIQNVVEDVIVNSSRGRSYRSA
jgi:hypothetical protein